MIDFLSGLLGSIIRLIYNAVGHNYLFALLIFTFLTKIILFPLMLKQLKSTKTIQDIAPEDKKLREKYKDNPQKLSEELTKLYADNHVSPMAGCLLPFIQIPIIVAMFWVVKQPLTYVSNMDKTEISNYTAQYLQKDEVNEKELKAYEINIAKEYNLMDMNVGDNFNLGDTPKDAFSSDESKRVSKTTLIIPILAFLFALISNKISQKNMTLTEDQAEMQKSMNFMMPLLSAYISYVCPMALGIYWLFGSILGIGQQLIMDKLMEDKSEKKDKKDKKNKILFLGKGDNND